MDLLTITLYLSWVVAWGFGYLTGKIAGRTQILKQLLNAQYGVNAPTRKRKPRSQ